MIKNIKENAKTKMEKSASLLDQELSKLRTGRATPALLDGIKVEYYGSTLPLNQVSSINIPEPRLIILQPWDKTALDAIEKAIYKSAIGLTPNNDGNVIRLPIPPLTTERREELVKLTQKLGEDTKVAIRNIRREANTEIKKEEKDKKISEDESFKSQEVIQKITDEFIEKVDEILKKKEKEIRET
ncbi:MAG: ribosome recycling factor [Candidatus Stahlbacteria bacterium]|jgi:ribosome recycling factor|nr:ribosome recycling factor [candidate division WOR-3 bacterium]MCK4673358.1 ribosome recycling factor [candidate division WOR-3 bacterium]TET59203.1 MAG: ribosome recycling factor [Candidatus Stahlbacteria bacterium]